MRAAVRGRGGGRTDTQTRARAHLRCPTGRWATLPESRCVLCAWYDGAPPPARHSACCGAGQGKTGGSLWRGCVWGALGTHGASSTLLVPRTRLFQWASAVFLHFCACRCNETACGPLVGLVEGTPCHTVAHSRSGTVPVAAAA